MLPIPFSTNIPASFPLVEVYLLYNLELCHHILMTSTFSNLTFEMNFSVQKIRQLHSELGLMSSEGVALSQSCISQIITDHQY